MAVGRAECIDEGDSKQCVDNLNCNGALITKEGEKWFVEVNGGRTLMINDTWFKSSHDATI